MSKDFTRHLNEYFDVDEEADDEERLNDIFKPPKKRVEITEDQLDEIIDDMRR